MEKYRFQKNILNIRSTAKTRKTRQRPVPGDTCWSQNRLVSLITEVHIDNNDENKQVCNNQPKSQDA
jgi:hypothetical protein